MSTPRTVDEIADAILPASIDGLHERALCLLLAEHERSFHKLENRCRLLESRSYAANERLDALERCEPGEEGRGCDGVATPPSSQPSSAAAYDQRAPGSTAPTTDPHSWQHDTLQPAPPQWETDARWLEREGGILMDIAIAERLRALAADRDRLAQELEDQVTERESVEKYADALASAIGRGDEGEHSNLNNPWQRAAEIAENLHSERDALARRIEAMKREQTERDIEAIAEIWDRQPQWHADVFRYVRDQLLATPESEPPSEPRCGLATASEPSEGPFVAPQPAPATLATYERTRKEAK